MEKLNKRIMRKEIIKITESDIRNSIKNTFNRIFNKTGLSDGIHELTNVEDFKFYSKQIWSILQRSYAPFGGFLTYHTMNDMIMNMSLAIICIQNNKIVACAIYRDDLGGQKLNGCGTCDGSESSKELLRSIIKDDIDNLQKWHWVEVSPPLEKWFKELGGNPIPSDFAAKILHKSKSKIYQLDDNVHYQRVIGNSTEPTTKAIYGFKDLKTYNLVMEKLTELTGFVNYEEFKNKINSSEQLFEDIDMYSNHENKTISVAMEIIIQCGNLYEDGWHEVTPQIYTLLKWAVDILENYSNDDKNTQVNGCLRSGKFYLNYFNVIEVHTIKPKDNYILAPAF